MEKWLKCDFHIHTNEDLKDGKKISYSPKELIKYAARKGFDCIAMSHHDSCYFNKEIDEYAKSQGIVLIPSIERTIKRRHVVILNPPKDFEKINDFSDLANLPKDSYVIAAHPYYVFSTCGGREFEQYPDYFDALEINAFYVWFCNIPNKIAITQAKKFGKSLVGNSDAHRLFQLNYTYTLVKAEKNKQSIISALKKNKIRIKTKPMPFFLAIWIFIKSIVGLLLVSFEKP